MDDTQGGGQDSGGEQSSGQSGGTGYDASLRGNNARGNGRGYPEIYREYDEIEPRYIERKGYGNPQNRSQSRQRGGSSSYQQEQGQGGGQPVNVFISEPKENENNMSCNCAHPAVIAGGLGYGGFGGYGGGYPGGVGITATQAMQPVEDKSCEILLALGNVRGEVKDAECSVKDSIMASNSQRQAAELSLHNRLCDAEKAAITAGYEARIESKETSANILARLEECCCDMKLMNVELKNDINEKFCALERRTDKDFAQIKEREDAREIFGLRADLAECRTNANNGALAQAIVAALQCAGFTPATHTHTTK